MVLSYKTRFYQIAIGILAMGIVECGYRPINSVIPGGGNAVAVPSVENQTPFGGLAGRLTSALRREIAMRGIRVLTSPSPASPRLIVGIVALETSEGLLTTHEKRLVSAANIVSITISTQLTDEMGGILKGPMEFSSEGQAMTGSTALAEESLAESTRDELLMKLAREVASSFFDGL